MRSQGKRAASIGLSWTLWCWEIDHFQQLGKTVEQYNTLHEVTVAHSGVFTQSADTEEHLFRVTFLAT